MDASDQTIGNWTVQQLVRFLQSRQEQSPPSKIPTLTCEDLDVTEKLRIFDQLQVNLVQTTVGSAGSASALPANPAGYFQILDNAGAMKLVPYYNS